MGAVEGALNSSAWLHFPWYFRTGRGHPYDG